MSGWALRSAVFCAVLCSVALAAPEPFRLGFNIGTVPSGTNIAKDGIAKWNATVPYKVSMDAFSMDFYLSLIHTDFAHSQLVEVTYHSDQVFEIDFLVDDVFINRAIIGEGYNYQKRMQMLLTCLTNDTGTATLTFMLPTYHPISFPFTHQCRVDKERRVGLMVASKPPVGQGFAPDVVQNGVALGAFSAIVVGPEMELTSFYTYIDDNNQNDFSQLFNLTVDSDELEMIAGVTPRGVIAERLSFDNPIVHFDVAYLCGQNPAKAPIRVTMTFPNNKYDALQFSYTKVCAGKKKHHHHNSGGWSVGGIIIFTMFIITLVFCTGGCAFNKFVRGASGLDIIPGYTLVNNMLPKDTSKYTPQADFAENGTPLVASNSGSYGTYQDNL